MYDAIGVRQETGKQSKLLNKIMEQNLLKLDNHEFQKRLKEFVGHTPTSGSGGCCTWDDPGGYRQFLLCIEKCKKNFLDF